MVTLNDITRATREAVTGGGNEGSEEIDQEQARIERAREEARREARRERTQDRVEQAREEARREVREGTDTDNDGKLSSFLSAFDDAMGVADDGDNDSVDEAREVLQTDFDGDGEPFAAEMGLQTQQRARQENEAVSELRDRVNRNTERIDEFHGRDTRARSGGGGDSGRERQPDVLDPEFDGFENDAIDEAIGLNRDRDEDEQDLFGGL